ncbi:hypothetical protein TURU_018749 [Turdus rufiventris]|nr:hypothetical protein TURU_018749 [Turdus rufiventris]
MEKNPVLKEDFRQQGSKNCSRGLKWNQGQGAWDMVQVILWSDLKLQGFMGKGLFSLRFTFQKPSLVDQSNCLDPSANTSSGLLVPSQEKFLQRKLKGNTRICLISSVALACHLPQTSISQLSSEYWVMDNHNGEEADPHLATLSFQMESIKVRFSWMRQHYKTCKKYQDEYGVPSIIPNLQISQDATGNSSRSDAISNTGEMANNQILQGESRIFSLMKKPNTKMQFKNPVM